MQFDDNYCFIVIDTLYGCTFINSLVSRISWGSKKSIDHKQKHTKKENNITEV